MVLDPSELAKLAYGAYSDSVDGLSVHGEPLADWDELSERVQTAWEVAAEAVARRALRLPATRRRR